MVYKKDNTPPIYAYTTQLYLIQETYYKLFLMYYSIKQIRNKCTVVLQTKKNL